jgi:hypothetical protein
MSISRMNPVGDRQPTYSPSLHNHEEELRVKSLATIEGDAALCDRWHLVAEVVPGFRWYAPRGVAIYKTRIKLYSRGPHQLPNECR